MMLQAWKNKSELEIAKQVIGLQGQLDKTRRPHEALWDVTGKLFLPRRADIIKNAEPGQRYGANIFDDTPAKNLKKFARGFLGFMVNKAIPWIQFTSSDQQMMDIDAIKQYYQAAEEQSYYALRRSNFYSGSPTLVENNACFGNASWIPLRDLNNDRVVFKQVAVKEAYWSSDYYEDVDVFHWNTTLTAKTLVEEYGADKVPLTVKQQAEGKNCYEKYPVIFAFYRNAHFDPDKLDVLSKRWVCFVVMNGAGEGKQKLLKIDGFDYGPIVWRSQVEAGCEYGTGICADALTVALMGNKLGEKLIQAAHLAVEPAVRAHENWRGKLRLNPGARNYGQKDEFIETLMDRMNWVVPDAERQQMRDSLDEWLFVKFFEMLSDKDLPQMTAYQASQMMGEKAVMMSTISGSFENEVCDDAIMVCLDHERRAGRMPDPPEELLMLGATQMDVQYLGILSQLQRSLFKSKGILEGMAVAGQWAQLSPESLDKIKGDEVLEEAVIAQGFPQKLIRTDEELEQIREARQRKQEMAEQAAMVTDAARAVPALSQPIEPNSPLSLLGIGNEAA